MPLEKTQMSAHNRVHTFWSSFLTLPPTLQTKTKKLYWPQSPGQTGRSPGGAGRLPLGAAGPAAEPEGRCSDRAGPTRPPPGWSGYTPPPPAATTEHTASSPS